MLRFSCPQCSHKMKAGDGAIGKRTRCGQCGNSFFIPAETPEESSEWRITPASPPPIVARPRPPPANPASEWDEPVRPKPRRRKLVRHVLPIVILIIIVIAGLREMRDRSAEVAAPTGPY